MTSVFNLFLICFNKIFKDLICFNKIFKEVFLLGRLQSHHSSCCKISIELPGIFWCQMHGQRVPLSNVIGFNDHPLEGAGMEIVENCGTSYNL